MTVATSIVEALGGTNKVARETGIPPQTVSAWKQSKGGIPHWRRPTLIELARRTNKALSPELTAYLTASRDPASRGEAGAANDTVSDGA